MKTAIVLCIDANYVEPAGVFLESLAENYHYRRDLDVVCVMPASDSDGFKRLKDITNLDRRINLQVKLIDDDKYPWLVGLSVDDRAAGPRKLPPSLWYRLLLGSILEEYDKAIYFDPDILIMNDVQPILDYPMKAELMATFDTLGIPNVYNLPNKHKVHFVSGVLILDLNWWRSSGIEDKFKNDLLENGPNELMDEYLLNKYGIDNWFPLPISFNFHAYKTNEYGIPDWDSSFLPTHTYKTAIVHHFAGQLKPWNFKKIAGIHDTSLLGAEWRRRHSLLGTKRKPRPLI